MTQVLFWEGGIKYVTDSVNAQGQKGHTEWSAKFDNKDYPVTGVPPVDSYGIQRIDDHTYTVIAKKDGHPDHAVDGDDLSRWQDSHCAADRHTSWRARRQQHAGVRAAVIMTRSQLRYDSYCSRIPGLQSLGVWTVGPLGLTPLDCASRLNR